MDPKARLETLLYPRRDWGESRWHEVGTLALFRRLWACQVREGIMQPQRGGVKGDCQDLEAASQA